MTETELAEMHPSYSPGEIARARRELGLTLAQLGYMLGYSGNQVSQMAYKLTQFERRTGLPLRPLRPCQARLLRAYLSGYRPDDWPS